MLQDCSKAMDKSSRCICLSDSRELFDDVLDSDFPSGPNKENKPEFKQLWNKSENQNFLQATYM